MKMKKRFLVEVESNRKFKLTEHDVNVGVYFTLEDYRNDCDITVRELKEDEAIGLHPDQAVSGMSVPQEV